MSQTGRKPKPRHLKIVTGNPGKRKINDKEPRPAPGAPPCPSHLDDEGRREWRRIVRALPPGMLTQADRAKLAGYCEAWSDVLRYRAELDKLTSHVVTTPNGALQQHPYVGMLNKAWERLYKFAGDFGLDPSSRSRLSVPEASVKDPAERFFGAEA